MKASITLLIAGCAIAMSTGCASGRVRAGQGTEMQQEREYEPEQKVNPPEGNISRVSGPVKGTPTPPPVIEIDLERRRPPPPREPDLEPDPKPRPEPDPETEP